jgi:predicted ATPase
MKKLILEIKNFGPINEAKIEIGKINIIAGQNASGKTTSSKLFYCLLAPSSSDGNFLRYNSFKERLDTYLLNFFRKTKNTKNLNEFNKLRSKLYSYPSDYGLIDWHEDIQEDFKKILYSFSGKNVLSKKELMDIDKIFAIQKDNFLMFFETLNYLFEIEFGDRNQLSEYFENSFVKISGNQNCDFSFVISDLNNIGGSTDASFLECFGVNEVSYFETPYILDFYEKGLLLRIFDHQQLLLRKLTNNTGKDVFDRKMNVNIIKFQKLIEEIVKGNFKFDVSSGNFLFEQEDKSFSSKNIASGIKSLGILLMLLENRNLPEDSYLIIDEPEVHLHPEWQRKLAEILVLMSKELNVTLYINSHSPQFIEFIEMYSKIHDIEKDTNFYLTEKVEVNGKFNINKIDNNDLKKIYANLGNPYDTIDKIYGKNLARKLKGSD